MQHISFIRFTPEVVVVERSFCNGQGTNQSFFEPKTELCVGVLSSLYLRTMAIQCVKYIYFCI
jgi:hypothetical protein